MLLEGFHFRTLDERGGINHFLNTGVDLGLDMRVLGPQVHHFNFSHCSKINSTAPGYTHAEVI